MFHGMRMKIMNLMDKCTENCINQSFSFPANAGFEIRTADEFGVIPARFER